VTEVGGMYTTYAKEAVVECTLLDAEETVVCPPPGLLVGFMWRGPQWRQWCFGRGERVDALVQS